MNRSTRLSFFLMAAVCLLAAQTIFAQEKAQRKQAEREGQAQVTRVENRVY